MARIDVLLVSLGTTRGLRLADAQFVELVRRAGATVEAVAVRVGLTDRLRRGYPVNDVVEALAARRALDTALSRSRPRAVVLSSTTAALLAGEPGVPFAVWLDSPARLNRPGARNAGLHLLERRRLAAARAVLVLSPPALAALPVGAAPAFVIAPPLQRAPQRTGPGEALAVGYTPDPKAKDLELLCRAWTVAAPAGARLVVTGIDPDRARGFLARRGLSVPAGLELAGMVSQEQFSRLLGEARAFVSAARWEDFGQAPLQALDHGALVVAAPAGGPFPALAITRELIPELVAADRRPQSLAVAIGTALTGIDETDLAAYRRAALERLRDYRADVQVRRLREHVLPLLLDP